uniref:Uncharacterized protein n=1 Tax=Fusarium oxysporum (strain Fo5176) TaxID=660025 RepID=A0A0D2YCK4_FUSOF
MHDMLIRPLSPGIAPHKAAVEDRAKYGNTEIKKMFHTRRRQFGIDRRFNHLAQGLGIFAVLFKVAAKDCSNFGNAEINNTFHGTRRPHSDDGGFERRINICCWRISI